MTDWPKFLHQPGAGEPVIDTGFWPLHRALMSHMTLQSDLLDFQANQTACDEGPATDFGQN